MKLSRALLPAALIGASIAGWALLSGEVPRWSPGGSRLAPHEPLPPLGAYPIIIAPGDTVRFEGDSDTSGSRIGGNAFAYPGVFAETIGHDLVIANHGRGGSNAPYEPPVLPDKAPPRLNVIMFGSNDAAVRGMLASREPVPLEDFRSRMVRLIRARQAEGAVVLVLAAPPAGGVAMDRRMDPYRAAARDAAARTGAHFRDPMEAYLGKTEQVLALYDALHLNREAQVLFGQWLARQVMVGRTAEEQAAGRPK